MTRRPNLDRPPTLEQYNDWNATSTRPLTDAPVGTTSLAKRAADARHSALVTNIASPRRRLTPDDEIVVERETPVCRPRTPTTKGTP